jgi:glycosyltransferase involved in cell wall biosynthesis
MARRHVLFIANTAWNLANFRRPIITALLSRGDMVTAIAGADGAEAQLLSMGCRFEPLMIDSKGTNPLKDAGLAFTLSRHLAALRPDIILCFTIKPVIYGSLAARWRGITVINTITGLGTAFIADTWITRIVQRLYRLVLPGPQPVVFQNGDDLALFRARRLIGGNPVTVVPGSGVDLSSFGFVPLPKQGPVTFLMIARLLGDKGVREYAEAARQVGRTHQNVRFQLLGPLGVANRTAIAQSELRDWVAEGTIDYRGETDDVRPFIAAAHCAVLPSYREGMPRVLLEAAAMGRPLIATDVTGCREVVVEGSNGFLCRVRDAGDLALKVEAFLALPPDVRRRMGEASRALAMRCFDARGVAATYLQLIDKQLSGTASEAP